MAYPAPNSWTVHRQGNPRERNTINTRVIGPLPAVVEP